MVGGTCRIVFIISCLTVSVAFIPLSFSSATISPLLIKWAAKGLRLFLALSSLTFWDYSISLIAITHNFNLLNKSQDDFKGLYLTNFKSRIHFVWKLFVHRGSWPLNFENVLICINYYLLTSVFSKMPSYITTIHSINIIEDWINISDSAVSFFFLDVFTK